MILKEVTIEPRGAGAGNLTLNFSLNAMVAGGFQSIFDHQFPVRAPTSPLLVAIPAEKQIFVTHATVHYRLVSVANPEDFWRIVFKSTSGLKKEITLPTIQITDLTKLTVPLLVPKVPFAFTPPGGFGLPGIIFKNTVVSPRLRKQMAG